MNAEALIQQHLWLRAFCFLLLLSLSSCLCTDARKVRGKLAQHVGGSDRRMGHLCEWWEDAGCPSLNTCRTCKAHEEDTADDRQEDYHTSWHPYACPQSCMYTRASYNISRRLPPFSFMEARGGRTESETANRKLTATAKLRIAPG